MSVRSTCFFLFLFLLMPYIPANGAGLEDADERLFKVQLAMAEKGKPRAQYYLGEMHEQGLGTKQDIDEAFKWYAKAAEQGDAMAKRKLALRQEIISEIRKEQAAEKLRASKPAVIPAKTTDSDKNARRSASISLAQIEHNRQEEEKIKKAAAEKEKRRAMVRAMILESKRNPVGELFE